ncbi:MAG: septum formation initiator family protein [Gemmatimonadetes bacterium]|jgi:cell division protein FtsB|nr:septum formation initiator family protein [Gemmatimonadota bacterium]
MTPRRWVVVGILVLAALFALQGGQYTTFDVLKLKRDLRTEQEAIDQLKIDVDSLGRVADAVEHDPRTQEKLARDQFGMIKAGEHLYRIVPSGDSAR